MKYTREQFIERAKVVHGKKYRYDNLVYTKMADPIYNVTCPIHGGFSISSASNFIHRNNACHICNVATSKYKQIWTTRWFIEQAEKCHGKKYDYSLVDYKKTTEKVTIICRIHGKYNTLAGNHIRGSICPKCSINIKRPKMLLSKEKFIEKAERVHGKKYDYTNSIYVGRQHPINIVCPIHGEFIIKRVSQFLIGQGCSKCKNR